MAEIELFQFQASHFNEKARWGLDWKAVPHEKISLLPGPHAGRMQKLTGQTQVPALRVDGAFTCGSAAILDWLEQQHPNPPLYPDDPALRERALAIQSEFDEEVGPAIRLAKFHEVLEASYAKRMFGSGTPLLKLTLWGALFPLVEAKIKREMGINPESAALALERTRQAFDFVAEAPGPEGYLVGSCFSVADLCCASLLIPGVEVGAWGGPPEVLTEKSKKWIARWADHPGAEWVREMYRRHRVPA